MSYVITTNNNGIDAGTGALTCGPITNTSLRTTGYLIDLSFVIDITFSNPVIDITPYNDTLYVLGSLPSANNTAIFFKIDNANTSDTVTNAGYNYNHNNKRIAAYNGYWYFAESAHVHVISMSSYQRTTTTPSGGSNLAYALFITSGGVLYTSALNRIYAFDLTISHILGNSLAGYSPTAGLGEIRDLVVSNNIIYAADYTKSRISTFNASTGDIIDTSFIVLGNPTAVEVYEDVLIVSYLGINSVLAIFNLTTGARIRTLNLPQPRNHEGMCVYNNHLYVTRYDSNNDELKIVSKFSINKTQYGIVTCNDLVVTNSVSMAKLLVGGININTYDGGQAYTIIFSIGGVYKIFVTPETYDTNNIAQSDANTIFTFEMSCGGPGSGYSHYFNLSTNIHPDGYYKLNYSVVGSARYITISSPNLPTGFNKFNIYYIKIF